MTDDHIPTLDLEVSLNFKYPLKWGSFGRDRSTPPTLIQTSDI